MKRWGLIIGAASLALDPLASAATAVPAWNVVEASDGGTCGASTDGSVLIATPDGVRYGVIVSNVTLGDHPQRDVRIDGASVTLTWSQLRTTAFTPLDDAGLARIASAKSIELQWPERTISIPTEGLAAILTKLKACGEAVKARRVETASVPPAGPGSLPGPPGPLVLTLECDGQGAWTAGGSVSSGVPGDVTHDREVTYASGGGGRVRLHFGPEANTVTFPATFPIYGRTGMKLASVEVSPDQILGKIHGLFGSPTILKVDRHSGDVNIDVGVLRFSGTCRKVSDAPEARKF